MSFLLPVVKRIYSTGKSEKKGGAVTDIRGL